MYMYVYIYINDLILSTLTLSRENPGLSLTNIVWWISHSFLFSHPVHLHAPPSPFITVITYPFITVITLITVTTRITLTLLTLVTLCNAVVYWQVGQINPQENHVKVTKWVWIGILWTVYHSKLCINTLIILVTLITLITRIPLESWPPRNPLSVCSYCKGFC